MDSKSIVLQEGLDLREVLTTGSILNINEEYEEMYNEVTSDNTETKTIDFIGAPLESFEKFAKQTVTLDPEGYVRKKIIEQGGGVPPNECCTISIVYSGYWENEPEPFDVRELHKPLVVNIKDNGLLPGLQIAVKSMLVGEMSAFLLSYQVMYGEMGIPPRIKPKANCIFYIKLLKSVLTPEEGELNLSESNMFQRVHHEVKMLYSSGVTLHKTNNVPAAIQLFRKGIYMLHKCRLADEKEQEIQEKLLIKLYTNLTICYNKIKQPLKACIACNELNRLNCFWNNPKVLFQNAKALKMIGEFDSAEKKLNRAKQLCPNSKEIDVELELIEKTRKTCDQNKLLIQKLAGPSLDLVSDEFKHEVNNLIKCFKENPDLCKLPLPVGLSRPEIQYIKELCIRENLFCNKIQKNYSLDKNKENLDNNLDNGELKGLSPVIPN